HLEALAAFFPLQRAQVWDQDADKAQTFARTQSLLRGFPVEAVTNACAVSCDIIVTCTTAHAPFLGRGDVSEGSFIAAVGADNPDKSEITPALMGKARVVVDMLEQCLAMGDLRHAVVAGALAASDVHADLAAIASGQTIGRTDARDIFLFD